MNSSSFALFRVRTGPVTKVKTMKKISSASLSNFGLIVDSFKSDLNCRFL
jgi:hypothetical protein